MAIGDLPSTQPAWDTTQSNQTEPSAAKKAIGWLSGEKNIASAFFNWLFYTIYEWTSWLASYTDASTGHVHDGGSNTTGTSPSAPKVAFPNTVSGDDHIDMGTNGTFTIIGDNGSIYSVDIAHSGAGSSNLNCDVFTATDGVAADALWDGTLVGCYTDATKTTFTPIRASELQTTGATVRSTGGTDVEFVDNVGARVGIAADGGDFDGAVDVAGTFSLAGETVLAALIPVAIFSATVDLSTSGSIGIGNSVGIASASGDGSGNITVTLSSAITSGDEALDVSIGNGAGTNFATINMATTTTFVIRLYTQIGTQESSGTVNIFAYAYDLGR